MFAYVAQLARLFAYPSGILRTLSGKVIDRFLMRGVSNNVIEDVRRSKLTYLSSRALLELQDAVVAVESKGIQGSIIEAGVGLGGSAIVIATAKQKERKLLLYDVFGTIPPPGEKDGIDAKLRYQVIAEGNAVGIEGDQYYGYQGSLRAKVHALLESRGFPPASNNIDLIQGTFQDSLHISEPVALAHIDCDWHESVSACLERITPNLSAGGRLIIDDYFHWSGCRKAIDSFFSGKKSMYQFERRAALHIIKE